MDIDRNPSTVVDHPHSPVGEDRHFDSSGKARHSLIDRVVDYFPDQVMKAPGSGRADIHAGPLAHCLEALEDGDVPGVIRGISVGGGQISSWRTRLVGAIRAAPKAGKVARLHACNYSSPPGGRAPSWRL